MYTAVDLFAGAGGLSLGFMQTGKYDIKVAFENSPYMQDTYRLNHPGVEVLGDVCSANYSDIMRKYGAIDVVIGGPPCQGFSNANRQKNHAISQNNMLVKQYLRAILELQPKAFVMENVSMLSSEVHRFYMEKRDEETIERCNIPVKDTLLHLLDAKFMFEKALTIVQSEKEISKYLWADAARTQNTIYLRLNYDEPSGTVVNVRKSMWIHPTQDRAISVREAARLQTFPDSFVFCGSKDKQYQQVGNAVPPIMAKSIAEKLAQILEKNLAGRERNG